MGPRTPQMSEDRSGAIEIVTYALTGAFVLFFITRQTMKAIVFRKLALDDFFILLATTFAIGLSITILILASKGFCTLDYLSVERANTILKGYYASELLYISSLCFSKLSILVLFYNVVVLRSHRFLVLGFGVCIFAWSVASSAAVAFQCGLPKPWEMMKLRCFNTRIFWVIFCVIDISTELFIVMLSVDLVAHLRVRMSRKLTVVACFAPRLLVVAAALIRAAYLYQVTPHSNLDSCLWATTICTHVHLCASICTACIPYMVPFFKSLQGNIWRSYSSRSWSARPRYGRASGQSPNRLRKREANIQFESPNRFNSLVKEPKRVSIMSPRIPSPTPISPFMPPPISTMQMLPTAQARTDSREARCMSVSGTVYDSASNEIFDMVTLQTAICFAPSPTKMPEQTRLSGAIIDVSEPSGYLALLGSPDPSSSSSCYSSRVSTPTRPEITPKSHFSSRDTQQYTPLYLAPQQTLGSPRTLDHNHLTTADNEVHRNLARQTLRNPAVLHGFDDFASHARSASSTSLPKFSTTPRLHAPPPTAVPSDRT